jgi:hypothetical protein
MFDIQNEASKARWQRILVNKMIRLEAAMRVELKTLMIRQAHTAADFVQHGITNVDAVLDRDVPILGVILIRHYRRTATTFSEDVFREIAKLKAEAPQEQKSMRDDFWMFFNQWARTHAASKAVGLNNVTKKLIARQISRGQHDGMSYGETANLIRTKIPALSIERAKRIARTEVHTASTLSTDKAVESTRLKFEREWVSVLDERTRFSHIRANGQRRGQNEAFDVGGEKLMYPGDHKGSAANVINCRCALLYHRVKTVQRRSSNVN